MNTKEIHELFGAVKPKYNISNIPGLGIHNIYKWKTDFNLGAKGVSFIFSVEERPALWRRILQRIIFGIKWEKI